MPDLVARLATLHATLTKRLTLQERLLSLNGRLDLVLSQIEMRNNASNSFSKQKAAPKREPKHYREDELSDEDEQMEVEVQKEEDDASSVEEVQLGNESPDEEFGDEEMETFEGAELDDDSDDNENDGDEDEDDSDDDGPHLNGFIDDEAEEDDYAEDLSSDDESE